MNIAKKIIDKIMAIIGNNTISEVLAYPVPQQYQDKWLWRKNPLGQMKTPDGRMAQVENTKFQITSLIRDSDSEWKYVCSNGVGKQKKDGFDYEFEVTTPPIEERESRGLPPGEFDMFKKKPEPVQQTQPQIVAQQQEPIVEAKQEAVIAKTEVVVPQTVVYQSTGMFDNYKMEESTLKLTLKVTMPPKDVIKTMYRGAKSQDVVVKELIGMMRNSISDDVLQEAAMNIIIGGKK